VQVLISEVFGILFKTHKELTTPVAEHLITLILPTMLRPNLSENCYKFAIYMIDDMVEHLGFKCLSKYWMEFEKVLTGFCGDTNVVLRQAACYGLGVYAQSTPAATPEPVEAWLNILIASSKIKKGAEKETSYGCCRDNAIAAIGKALQAHIEQLTAPESYLDFWLGCLPLRFDKPEALAQH
jgi:hypothetical protein